MSSTFLTDICDLYINEVIQPQLGKPSDKKAAPAAPAAAGPRKVEKGKEDSESSAKRIRQAVYDIRYRARRENIPLEQAFNQYMAHTSMGGSERTAVREKLGLSASGGGSSAPVKEEYVDEANRPSEQKFKVRVSDKSSGKSYVRYASRAKIEQLRKNPNISSVEMTGYGEPYEGEKQKGERTAAAKAGKDWDGDGKVESGSKEHAGVVHNAIQRSKGGVPDGQDTRKKLRKESYSNWRNDLIEVVNDVEAQKQITDKKVNNYKNKVVTINPEVQENFQIIEMVELDEEYLNETVDIATEYFFNQGLNDEGLEIVIEELGLEKFTDFVFYISEEYTLTEARRSGRIEPVSKSGKSIASLKGGAKASAIRAKKKEKAARDKTDDRPSGMTAALRSQSSIAKKITTDKGEKAVEKAKQTQSSKKPVRDAIARGIFGAVKAYQSGMERHKKAMSLAKETGKTVAKAAKVTHEAGRRAGESKIGQAVKRAGSAAIKAGVEKAKRDIETTKKMLKNEFEMWINELIEEGYDLSEYTWEEMFEIYEAKKMEGGDPCWKGYEMVGTKKKGGKEVPNCVSKEEYDIHEVSPPGFKGTVKAMKKHREIDNPYALAWYMKNRGFKSHKKASGASKNEEYEYVDEAISKVPGRKTTRTSSTQRRTELQQARNSQRALVGEQSFDIDPSAHRKQQRIEKATELRNKATGAESGAAGAAIKRLGGSGVSLPVQKAHYEPEGEVIDERRREEKGTPRKPRDKAFELIAKSMGTSRMGVQPRGVKKQKGGPTPGPSVTPAQKVAKKRAQRDPYPDDVYSRDSTGGIRGYRSGD